MMWWLIQTLIGHRHKMLYKNDTIIHYLFIASLIQQFSWPSTMSKALGWHCGMTDTWSIAWKNLCIVQRDKMCTPKSDGEETYCESLEGCEIPFLLSHFLPSSLPESTWGWRDLEHLNLCHVPFSCAKQTFLQTKILYVLAVKRKEDRRTTSQKSQGVGHTGEFWGQLCCG